MAETASNIRRERIEKLLYELRYEVERGMMQGEIDETIGFRFYVPVSKSISNGVVFCEFRTRPILAVYADPRAGYEPRLRVVGGRDAPPTDTGG